MGAYFSKPPKTQSKITGRVAIVTGGNRGIGFATVKQLYELGATVYMGSRSEANALKAIEQIRAAVPGSDGQLKWFIADMSSIRKAKQAAETFLKMESQLDILIHNAGIAGDFELNEDGIEAAMATNHIGPFVFTKAVLGLMKKTSSKPGSDVRIVSVASVAHTRVNDLPVKFKDEADLSTPFPASSPANYNTWTNTMARYGRSKLANILFISELQRRLDAEKSNIIALSLCPGPVATDGAMDVISRVPILGHISHFLIGYLFPSIDDGALNSRFAAANPVVRAEPNRYKGKYLTSVGKITAPSKLGQDNELAKQLWDLSESAIESRTAT